MTQKTIKTRVVNKHDIEANWLRASTFIPKQGELIIYDDRYVDAEGVEHIVADAVRFKIGNGVDNVNDLAFISSDAILDVEQLPEAGIKSNVFYRTANSIGTYYINIEGEVLQFPTTIYYVDTLPEVGIETKFENLLTDGFHIYKQKEDNLTYTYSFDDVSNVVEWGAGIDTPIVDTVEELNGEDGIVISESVNSIYTRNSENTDWVQLLSAGDTYTKTEIDEITAGLNTRLDEFYTEVLDEENQNSLKNEIPDLYNYIDGHLDSVYGSLELLDDFNSDISTLYDDKLDKVTEEAQYERVYVVDVDGTQTVENLVHDSALKWSIPRRYAHGEVVVGEPTAANHATTKKYVDDGFVPKLQIAEGTGTFAYIADTNNAAGKIQIQYGAPIAYTLPARDAGGVVVVGTPVSDQHAATKKYVDNAVLNIPVSSLKWSSIGVKGLPTLTGQAMVTSLHGNKLNFMRSQDILIEYSHDSGATWGTSLYSAANKVNLVTETDTLVTYYAQDPNAAAVPASTADRLRITLTAEKGILYFSCKELLIYFSTNGAKNCKVLLERANIGSEDTFSTIGTYDVAGWSGWNSVPCQIYFGGSDTQTGQMRKLRLTFYAETIEADTQRFNVYKIYALGDTMWNGDPVAKNNSLFTYDTEKTAKFPATVSAKEFVTTDGLNIRDSLKSKVEVNGEKVGTQQVIINDISETQHIMDVTISSKNLIPYPYDSANDYGQELKGLTITEDNGVVVINGTATADGAFDFISPWVANPRTIPLNGTYTIGPITTESTNSFYVQPYIDGSSKTVVSNKPVSYTVNNGQLTRLTLFYKTGAVFNNTRIAVQLEKGEVATTYAPPLNVSTVQVTRYGQTESDNPATYSVNADGKIVGVTSLYPITTLKANNSSAIITAVYNSKNNNLLVHETGDSYTKVMSQKAVTEELDVVDNRIERIFGTTEYVEEAVYYDESKLTYSDYVNGCEYDYNAHTISMIFNESDFVVDNPIYIKFQVCSYSYSATYHAYGYIYKSSDGQIYIGDQEINTDADAALYMHKNGNEIHVIIYLPDSSSSYFNAYASIPFTVSYDKSYTSDEIIPEKLLYVTKEIEIYDTVKEAERAQTATTATTASTATKASQDSNGYSFTTYYTKAPSSNPLSISGNNLQVKYTKGNNTTSSYSIDLSKATAVSNALSSATAAANNAKELIGYEVPGEPITFDEAALSYENSYENCYFTNSSFYIRLAKSDIEANKDKPIYIRIKEGSQIEDYTIIYSPDNAAAEERSPYITAYCSDEYIGDTYWYENASYIALSKYPIAGYGGYVTAVASCNIPIEIVDQYNHNSAFHANSQEVSLEKIEKFTPAACAKGLLAEDGVSKITFEDIKAYIDQKIAEIVINVEQ